MSKREILNGGSTVQGELARRNPPFVRSPYNYDVDQASDESGLYCADPSLTSQHFAQEADINWIVNNYVRDPNGQLPLAPVGSALVDLSEIPADYHSAMNQLRQVDGYFMQLPAAVRSQFGNDAGSLLRFLADDANRDKAVELGLLAPKEDLSTGAFAGSTDSKANEPVGKSGKVEKTLKKAFSGIPRGFKLVPDEGGESGDE